MITYFTERARGWRVLAHVAAPIIWFQAALFATGIYARYAAAQGGATLEETPFFSAALAAERLRGVVASEAVGLALVFQGLDLINAVLLAAGLAALIGFGLRAIGQAHSAARYIVLAPAGLAGAELVENLSLTAALALDPLAPGAVGAIAGLATGVKFIFFALCALLALAGLVLGVVVFVIAKLKERS